MLYERWDINSQKTKSDVSDTKNLQWSPEYVFIPITRSITIDVKDRTIVINPGAIQITLGGTEHITTIGDGRIHNVLVITGHVVDERNSRLVPTLSSCNYVKGILVNAKPQQTKDFLTLKLPANKLYLIRKKGKIPDVLTIHVPYSNPDANNSVKTRLVQVDEIDKLINEVFEKIYTISQSHKEKFKEDIKELFEYYHALEQ